MTIFRDEALKRLSSPERLDEALVAAAPLHWIGYSALTLVVGAAILWGVLGTVPTRVSAEGILLRHGSEVYSATSEGQGELISFSVELGARVDRGQVVATLDLTDVERRRDLVAGHLDDARQRLAERIAQRGKEGVAFRALIEKRRAAIDEKIANAQHRIRVLTELAANLSDLFAKGYAQRTTLLEREQALIGAQEALLELDNQRIGLDESVFDHEEGWRRRIQEEREAVRRFQDEAEELAERLDREKTVDAPVAGIVTEISASLGDVVTPGVPVVRIVTEAAEMDALLFINPSEGRLVEKGFTVNIEPSTARKEEYGTILATVQSVSPLPVSSAAIQAMLHNDTLVRAFTQDGAPVVVRADIEEFGPDRFVWTGGDGPGFAIVPGTLANATITVRRQAPATLILPFLRSLIGA